MISGVPMILARGTKPQKRLSFELSRLSPIMKYSSGGTTSSPFTMCFANSSGPLGPVDETAISFALAGKFSDGVVRSLRGCAARRARRGAVPFTNTCPFTILRWSPGTPMQRLMKSGIALVGQRRAKHDNLLPLRIAPQRNVIWREGNSSVVAEAAHDQMIADQHRRLHRAARNHARLHEGAFDEKKRDDDPKPGNDLAPDLIAARCRIVTGSLFQARVRYQPSAACFHVRASRRASGSGPPAVRNKSKQPVPANLARMDDRVQISLGAFTRCAPAPKRLPGASMDI